jgi:hypothetical protein
MLRALTVASVVSSAAKSVRKPSARKETGRSQSSSTQPEQPRAIHARNAPYPAKHASAAGKPIASKARAPPAPSMATILETTFGASPPKPTGHTCTRA